MKEFTEKILQKAKDLGASYADVRIIKGANESINIKNGKVDALAAASDYGFGVRVIVNGSWGFASSFTVTDEEAEKVVQQAVSIARASSRLKREDVKLAPVEPAEGHFESEWKINPFDVPLEDKINLLLDADKIMRQQPEIKISEGQMNFWKTDETYASTEGSYIEQVKIESGAGIEATAIEAGEMQRRSYPAFGGDYASRGYEFVEGWNLVDHAESIAKEAAELLKAPQCPSDTRDLILEGSMLALQVHESCGHPIELDRVFGTESSFAGTSFLTTDKLNTFRYGSDKVNIVADATAPGGLGSFSFDDEGVPAQCVDIVKNGIFSGYLSSRETAAQMGWESSGGAMRADGWSRIPIIRMTNINLLPGDWTFDEIIKDTKDGIYAAGVQSWSIDDKRLNFQFGTEVAWEIKDGSLGRMLKNPTYTGITYEFWRGCDAIAGKDEWHLWGVPSCGKGEPMQTARVGHGVAPSRFRNVRIGVMESQSSESEE
ncbi:MAG TPA: TldD/PmbA family protein [Armatimonadota bacterium]|nr:TldD/PmbA family protein [Armatimonadota bacterium]